MPNNKSEATASAVRSMADAVEHQNELDHREATVEKLDRMIDQLTVWRDEIEHSMGSTET